MKSVLVVLAVVAAMEPLTYLAHRYVMHGVGWVIHSSHHRPRETRIELNDLFPAIFATLTIALFAIGRTTGTALLIPVATGVTIYGAAYSFVHDVYIHGRFFKVGRIAFLEPLKRAHILHHLYDGEPYGMLVPLVPRRIRERARLLYATQGEAAYSAELLKGGNFGSPGKYVVVD